MTLNELIGILQDHAYGEHGDSEVRMVSADTGGKIDLKAIQMVQSARVGAGIIGEVEDYVQLVFRTETR